MSAQEIPPIVSSVDDEDQSIIVRPTRAEVIKVIVLGLAAGLVIPALSFVFKDFFIEAVFCSNGDNPSICSSSTAIAYYVASGIVAGISVVLLASWQVFKPLLMVAGALAALWGLGSYLSDIASSNPVEYYALSAALYCLTYILFYWTMRIRNFIASLVVTVLLVAAIRWLVIA